MRTELKKENGERTTFVANIEKFGVKSGWRGPEKTILLTDVRFSDGRLATDHIWFACGVSFENLALQSGMKIQFDARVKKYEKGYKGFREDVYCPVEVDYKLANPTKIKLL